MEDTRSHSGQQADVRPDLLHSPQKSSIVHDRRNQHRGASCEPSNDKNEVRGEFLER
ncbi:hypothetical protein CERZMDRAFT_103562 [Cercospora zeae-maydis SCOH1-5]|uniref:Uncharacterized protein n=1 Tax=Cercospora zeae-maydis SCOH1-5 TaxID=717836 RepID=A0A6A6EYL1_9PEZI|nr:hypothetical protein CERZMDRAFT_103562 [Cercospora zeae-maydis SCOH1-5]